MQFPMIAGQETGKNSQSLSICLVPLGADPCQREVLSRHMWCWLCAVALLQEAVRQRASPYSLSIDLFKPEASYHPLKHKVESLLKRVCSCHGASTRLSLGVGYLWSAITFVGTLCTQTLTASGKFRDADRELEWSLHVSTKAAHQVHLFARWRLFW